VPKPLAVNQRPLPVVAVADLALIDAEVLGNDHGADLVDDVVPGERPKMRTWSVPPDHTHLVELRETCSCSLDAGEVKLVKLMGGKDPMLMKMKADELISFGDG
jgi:hypothetical protein